MSKDKTDRTIRCGYVSAIDYDKGYVQMTYPDLDGAVSDWLPMMTVGTEYKMPKVGQQMVAMHLPNGMDSGFVLGGYWSEDDKPTSTGEGVFRKDMGEGCYMEFSGGTLTIHASEIKLEADSIKLTGTSIEVDGTTIDISGGTVTIGDSGTINGLTLN